MFNVRIIGDVGVPKMPSSICRTRGKSYLDISRKCIVPHIVDRKQAMHAGPLIEHIIICLLPSKMLPG